MYFTSGSDRAFEQLMQGKPGFDHYGSGGAGAPEDCGDCRFYRPDWKYQFCVYAECPYQPGKLTALDATRATLSSAAGSFYGQKIWRITMKSNIRNEIKAQIIRAGYTMQEVVDQLHDEYGWSDSVSNLSGKLQRESLRYREAVELADVLGYDIIWQKQKD